MCYLCWIVGPQRVTWKCLLLRSSYADSEGVFCLPTKQRESWLHLGAGADNDRMIRRSEERFGVPCV